jgi:hypothetical protein
MDSALKTGFALMKANYVERDAPELLGGRIQGLAPEARDIAVSLRESISARFESLRFHHLLMQRIGHPVSLDTRLGYTAGVQRNGGLRGWKIESCRSAGAHSGRARSSCGYSGARTSES